MAQLESYWCLCGERLQYQINIDLYVCKGCKKHFDVLSTEKTHGTYDGGPPKEITDGAA